MGKSKLPSFWLDDTGWGLPHRSVNNIPIESEQPAATRPRRDEALASDTSAAPVIKKEAGQEMVVSLHLSLPKIRLPQFGRLYRAHKKRVLAGVGVVAMLGVITTGGNYIMQRRQAIVDNTPKTAVEQALAQAHFTPLVPLDAASENSEARTSYKYDAEKQVLGYSTQVTNATITVSQQQLPAQFQTPAELAKLAQSINASDSIETQNGTAYIATDPKTNYQTALFATKEVLVFLRSNQRVDAEDWRVFINQLNPEIKH